MVDGDQALARASRLRHRFGHMAAGQSQRTILDAVAGSSSSSLRIGPLDDGLAPREQVLRNERKRESGSVRQEES
ncbi:MAG: hypothetical protein IPM29_05155 [Planctomycetes bacterium]|nr:hypothetical protein [Planctomycetota bacterium]